MTKLEFAKMINRDLNLTSADIVGALYYVFRECTVRKFKWEFSKLYSAIGNKKELLGA